ncbi:MAG: D-aminoacyl-tRNA deacylase [Lachnospiraceae bacterium]|nr:D-aminoacyl-tRNA deacylase [Lachnospiraceae bacterium]
MAFNLSVWNGKIRKTNLSRKQVNGELLFVSQFTLLADCKGQNRPGFTRAGNPDHAKAIYDHMVQTAKKSIPVVEVYRLQIMFCL